MKSVRNSLLTISVLFSIIILASYLLGSCKKEQNTRGLQLMQQEIPEGFPAPNYTFTDNPSSKEGFELGRKLFYDGRLSIDNEHSCASCHQQLAAFGTYQHDRSHGVFNSHTLRNAPSLFNLAWNTSFHWDGEFSNLTDEAAQPINGHIEMGETYEGIINKIKDDPEYQKMFKEVFRYPFIRPEFILKALEQFTGSMVSANSKYDLVYRLGLIPGTVQEASGYQIYRAKCATCHPEPLFTDNKLHNTGLQTDLFLNDYGRMQITQKKEDSLKFKTPSLRNSYVSANYMHDGRFNTLLQCINHYRSGVQQSATLDPLLVNGISLTNTEATDLSVFLRMLTDSSFLKDPRYSKPQ
jgi:cytochrome c peroxidase